MKSTVLIATFVSALILGGCTPDRETAAGAPSDPGDRKRGEPDRSAARAAMLAEFDGSMVELAGGSFTMGDVAGNGMPDEQPVHRVRVSPFELARHEVTRGQFARFVEATGYVTDAERDVGEPGCYVLDLSTGNAGYRQGHSWRDPGLEQDDDHPVVCVSWNDATAFLDWLNRAAERPFRLPTEAEWEYAARAGSQSVYPWGTAPGDACRHANIADATPWPSPPGGGASPAGGWKSPDGCSDGFFFTSPVGSFEPNAFGLFDMIGNVWEWGLDCWSPDYENAPSTSQAWMSGDCSRRINRGGAWANTLEDFRVSNRYSNLESQRYVRLGFRLARDSAG